MTSNVLNHLACSSNCPIKASIASLIKIVASVALHNFSCLFWNDVIHITDVAPSQEDGDPVSETSILSSFAINFALVDELVWTLLL